MVIRLQGGSRSTDIQRTLKGYGQVWLDEGGVVNILSFSKAKAHWGVWYDSEGDSFVVDCSGGLAFDCSRKGLYYYDTAPGPGP